MNWYREQMEIVDEDVKRLSQLLNMMDERYRLSQLAPCDLERINPMIISVHREIASRIGLLMKKSPQD
jgi:signal transduction histidine kinase